MAWSDEARQAAAAARKKGAHHQQIQGTHQATGSHTADQAMAGRTDPIAQYMKGQREADQMQLEHAQMQFRQGKISANERNRIYAAITGMRAPGAVNPQKAGESIRGAITKGLIRRSR